MLQEMTKATKTMFIRQGLSREDAAKEIINDGHRLYAAEQTLFAEIPLKRTTNNAKPMSARQDFARRSYIRAAFA